MPLSLGTRKKKKKLHFVVFSDLSWRCLAIQLTHHRDNERGATAYSSRTIMKREKKKPDSKATVPSDRLWWSFYWEEFSTVQDDDTAIIILLQNKHVNYYREKKKKLSTSLSQCDNSGEQCGGEKESRQKMSPFPCLVKKRGLWAT